MRIGFFTTDFPYKAPFSTHLNEGEKAVWGGVGEVVYQLALRLAARGHEIVIHTTSASRSDNQERHGSITLKRYGRDLTIAHTEISLHYLRHPDDDPVDIVHLHAGSPPATVAALSYLKNRDVPLVTTHHLDPDPYGGLLRRTLVGMYAHFFLEKALAKSDRIIGLSPEFVHTSPYLTKYPERIQIIPNGIDVDEFCPSLSPQACRQKLGLPLDEPLILFLGNLIERKGPHILLEAMPRILQEIPTARVVLAGSPSGFNSRLQQICQENGIEDRVTFTGFVAESEKPCLYRAADLYACPSFAEAFPLVLLEAAACGLPLIASDLEVFRVLINDGENGLFFRMGDAAGCSEQIRYLLLHDDVRRQMGERSVQIARQYSWDSIAAQTEELYRNLVRVRENPSI